MSPVVSNKVTKITNLLDLSLFCNNNSNFLMLL